MGVDEQETRSSQNYGERKFLRGNSNSMEVVGVVDVEFIRDILVSLKNSKGQVMGNDIVDPKENEEPKEPENVTTLLPEHEEESKRKGHVESKE